MPVVDFRMKLYIYPWICRGAQGHGCVGKGDKPCSAESHSPTIQRRAESHESVGYAACWIGERNGNGTAEEIRKHKVISSEKHVHTQTQMQFTHSNRRMSSSIQNMYFNFVMSYTCTPPYSKRACYIICFTNGLVRICRNGSNLIEGFILQHG